LNSCKGGEKNAGGAREEDGEGDGKSVGKEMGKEVRGKLQKAGKNDKEVGRETRTR
jgi:hypothetical protein